MRSHGFTSLLCLLAAARQTLAQVRGVNVGGWLVTEKWMSPSIYANTTAEDEWHLCNQLGKAQCLTVMQEHWNTYYTRDDFVDIKNAGLNMLRIPIGYWAIDLLDYEPYVPGQYPYLIQAVQWAKELGLSVMISMHGAPGSQNGADTSGLIGPVLFATNTSNIDRTLNVLKNLTTEFSRDVYGGTVVSIELLNEPGLFTTQFIMAQLQQFYTQATTLVHSINSTMNVVLADAFYGPAWWANYNPVPSQSMEYTVLDAHQFYAFPPLVDLNQTGIIERICSVAALVRQTVASSGIPVTVFGEWSLQSGIPVPANTSVGLTQADRTWLRLLFEAQIAAYSSAGAGQVAAGWIFWAWKTEDDSITWSYRRGITSKWIPADVSDSSQLVYPVNDTGCVDSTFNYQAPASITPYNQSVWAHPASDDGTGGSASPSTSSSKGGSSSAAKGGASPAIRLKEVPMLLSLAILAVMGASLL